MTRPSTEPDPEPRNRYQHVQQLGQGSFGFVNLAWDHHTTQHVAIKCLRCTDLTKYVESEIINHSLLRHPHVIQFREVYLTDVHICIVMEYASEGSLFGYVQRQGMLKESVARWFFQQLIIGVDYCHRRGVANRDLKLENALLHIQPGHPLPLLKICDFGYSKADVKSAPKSKVGTLTYMAPEVLISPNGKYNGKVADIWSCGVMLYVMLYGQYPFGRRDGQAVAHPQEVLYMLEAMIEQRYAPPQDVAVSVECQALLQGMLHPDPRLRFTIQQIISNPWFLQYLPADAVRMNDVYLRQQWGERAQPRHEIDAILSQARGTVARSTLASVSEVSEETWSSARSGVSSVVDEARATGAISASRVLRDYLADGGSAAVQDTRQQQQPQPQQQQQQQQPLQQ